MEIYLVGGAVRDQLLGEPIKERDYVVVGATPEEMLNLGYQQVGKSFPVFLHPKTHEEYALARTERKTGKGYTEFAFDVDPQVTLEEDLKRRDLTINAIAETLDGKLIDPYHGQEDLKNRILHHVSPAFAEDPLRVLRVARFAARFYNFKIHPETLTLMKSIVNAGEIEFLVPERVWQELARALHEKHPERFFITLQECGALQILFPEFLTINFSAALKALQNAVKLSGDAGDAKVRFAALCMDLEKIAARKLCHRLRSPRAYRELILLVINNKQSFAKALKFNAEELILTFNKLDAFRRQDRFQQFLLASESHSQTIPSAEYQHLSSAFNLAINVSSQQLISQGLNGQAIKKALQNKRIEIIKNKMKV